MKRPLAPAWRRRRLALGVLLCAVTSLVDSGAAAAQQSAPAPQGSKLSDGTFLIGDRILLSVADEKQLTDTFTVVAGPAVVFPVIGSVSLAGVKRVDIERHLAEHIARFIRDPVVHAHALVRLAINGEVVRPGFYYMQIEFVVADALMSAGGPTANAQVDKVRIERKGASLFTADSLRAAIASGTTLAQLDLQAADAIIVPKQAARIDDAAKIVGIVSSFALAIFGIIRLFK